MTGYGTAQATIDTLSVQVTVRSRNSRYLDIQIDAPRAFEGEWLRWRALCKKLQRGAVVLRAEVGGSQGMAPWEGIKQDLIDCYHTLDGVAQELKTSTDCFPLAVQWLQSHPTPHPTPRGEALYALVEKALEDCQQSRRNEGQRISRQFTGCIEAIRIHLGHIDQQLPLRIVALRKRLAEKIQLRAEAVDCSRWEQEILYYVEKMSVEEECVRLASHTNYLEQLFSTAVHPGKKIGFVLQEMVREINTLGAKAQDLILQRHVIEVKDQLEAMREQVQNIL